MASLAQRGVAVKWTALDGLSGVADRDLIVADNQHVAAIPAKYAVIGVQHGCAGEHKARVPGWACGDMIAVQRASAARRRTFWVGCSEWAAFYCHKHYGRHANRIIYGAVDLSKFKPGERQRRRDAARPVVLHHCADPNKGRDVIDALATACGDAFEFRRLNVPPDQVPDAMRESDMWLCLSAAEGLPTVVQEAIATGLAVVSTDVGVSWQPCSDMGTLVMPWGARNSIGVVTDLRTAWESRAGRHPRLFAEQWYGLDLFAQKWAETIDAASQSLGVR